MMRIAMSDTRALAEELATYEKHRLELLDRAKGKWVLIHGKEVAGTFDTQSDAIREGYRRYGNVPFLVKEVVEVERPQHFVSHLLAV